MFRFDDADTIPFRLPMVMPDAVVEAIGGYIIPMHSVVRAYGAVIGVTVSDAGPGQLVAVRTAGVVVGIPSPPDGDGSLIKLPGFMPSGTAIEVCEDLELVLPDGIGIVPIPGRVLAADPVRGLYTLMLLPAAGEGGGLSLAEVQGMIAAAMADVDGRIALGIDEVVGSAPAALNSLEELADALQNNPNAIANLTNLIAAKQDAADALDLLAASDPTALGINLLEAADGAAVRALIGAAAPVAAGTYATPADLQALKAQILGAPPAVLDQISELAAALGNDPNFATTVATALAGKQASNAFLTALTFLANVADGNLIMVNGGAPTSTSSTVFGRKWLQLAAGAAAGTIYQVDATGNLVALLTTAKGRELLTAADTRAAHTALAEGFTISKRTTATVLNPGVETRIGFEQGELVTGSTLDNVGGSYNTTTNTLSITNSGIYQLALVIETNGPADIDFNFRYVDGSDADTAAPFDYGWPFMARVIFPSAKRYAVPGLLPLMAAYNGRRLMITAKIDAAAPAVTILKAHLSLHKIG